MKENVLLFSFCFLKYITKTKWKAKSNYINLKWTVNVREIRKTSAVSGFCIDVNICRKQFSFIFRLHWKHDFKFAGVEWNVNNFRREICECLCFELKEIQEKCSVHFQHHFNLKTQDLISKIEFMHKNIELILTKKKIQPQVVIANQPEWTQN